MRFTDIDINFDVKYEGHQNCPKILSMNILRVFSDHHMWRQNWHQYLWTSLFQFIFLRTSSIVQVFDFLTFDIFLTTWHLLTFDIFLTSFDILAHYLNHLSSSLARSQGGVKGYTWPMVPHTPVPQCPCGPYPLYPMLMWPIHPVSHTPVPYCPMSPYWVAHTPVPHTPCTLLPPVPYWSCGPYPCTPYPLYPIAPSTPIAHTPVPIALCAPLTIWPIPLYPYPCAGWGGLSLIDVSKCQKDVKLSKRCQISKSQTCRLWSY